MDRLDEVETSTPYGFEGSPVSDVTLLAMRQGALRSSDTVTGGVLYNPQLALASVTRKWIAFSL
jgi:hypothetical protein